MNLIQFTGPKKNIKEREKKQIIWTMHTEKKNENE